jgi:hypothetical protein
VTNSRFLAAAGLAVLGIGLGIAGAVRGTADNTSGGPGIQASAGAPAPAKDISSQLGEVRRTLQILPAQEAAWQRYVQVMEQLGRERREFDLRVARGEAKDDGTEYWRHQFVLSDAITELFSHLTPAQIERARPMTQFFAANSICRGLARN